MRTIWKVLIWMGCVLIAWQAGLWIGVTNFFWFVVIGILAGTVAQLIIAELE